MGLGFGSGLVAHQSDRDALAALARAQQRRDEVAVARDEDGHVEGLVRVGGRGRVRVRVGVRVRVRVRVRLGVI